MNVIHRQTLISILETDISLSINERNAITSLLQLPTLKSPRGSDTSLGLSQKHAAQLLGIDRITMWRYKNSGILVPIEILPGIERYCREEVENLARHGFRHHLKTKRAA